MRILIFGGTGFLGRHLVEAALAQGHTLTLFNRGTTAPNLFPEIEQIHANRDGGLSGLQNRTWDAIIDSNGRIPRLVHEAAQALANSATHYTFISSISVYAENPAGEVTEDSPVEKLKGASAEEVTGETYGALKYLCEQVAQQTFPGSVLIVRPGLIVGPHDSTDRFTYWPHRIARGGEVLAPGLPAQKTQFIDARDLSAWVVRMIELKQTGTYNATGPAQRPSMLELLEACKQVSNSSASFTWVSEEFIEEQKLEAYTELPLWVPSSYTSFLNANTTRARSAGLTYRPLEETIRATLAWDATRDPNQPLKSGLTSEREQALLQLWHTHETQQASTS